MVRTGRWANTLVRTDQFRTLTEPQSVGRNLTMPRVTMTNQLRPPQCKPIDALFDEKACVCGLVNVWETIKKVPGHKQVGQELASVMDKFFDTDAGAVLEKDIFDAIGSDNADCDDLIERLSPLRQLMAQTLLPTYHLNLGGLQTETFPHRSAVTFCGLGPNAPKTQHCT